MIFNYFLLINSWFVLVIKGLDDALKISEGHHGVPLVIDQLDCLFVEQKTQQVIAMMKTGMLKKSQSVHLGAAVFNAQMDG